MPDRRSPGAISRDHAEHFLRRERRDLGRLRADVGSEVLGTLDRVLARELIHDRRQRALDEVFGAVAFEGGGHDVVIAMRSLEPRGHAWPRDMRKRRRVAASVLRRSAAHATDRLRPALDRLGAQAIKLNWLVPGARAVLSAEALEEIAARSDVRQIVSNKVRPLKSLNDSRPKIRGPQVEGNLGFDGAGITVAVLDSGVDAAHPALAGAVTVQEDFSGEGIGDLDGHGTHCAGIVASRDAKFRGVAPAANIADLKILTVTGGTAQAAQDGLARAVVLAVDVTSNSYGASHADGAWTDADGTCVFCMAIDTSVAGGVMAAVAAGNNDDDSCATYDTHIDCPGNARDALTVGATDDDDDMASFSSIGPTPDGRAKPDVVAPGDGIISARAAGTSSGDPVDATWTSVDGTSQATPHVAGIAALMLQKTPALTPADLKGLIVGTTVNLGFTPEEMGSGRVDALAAVTAA